MRSSEIAVPMLWSPFSRARTGQEKGDHNMGAVLAARCAFYSWFRTLSKIERFKTNYVWQFSLNIVLQVVNSNKFLDFTFLLTLLFCFKLGLIMTDYRTPALLRELNFENLEDPPHEQPANNSRHSLSCMVHSGSTCLNLEKGEAHGHCRNNSQTVLPQ